MTLTLGKQLGQQGHQMHHSTEVKFRGEDTGEVKEEAGDSFLEGKFYFPEICIGGPGSLEFFKVASGTLSTTDLDPCL